jgi:glycine oxidase
MSIIRKYDLAIVGQGIAGSLLAWELWKRGVDFVVIDSPVKHKSSNVAAGLFYPLSARKPTLTDRFELYNNQMQKTYSELETYFNASFLHEKPSLRKIEPEDRDRWQNAANTELLDVVRLIETPNAYVLFETAVQVNHSGYVDLVFLISLFKTWLNIYNRLIVMELSYDQIQVKAETVQLFDSFEANQVVFCEGESAVHNPWFAQVAWSLNKGELIEILAPELDEQFIFRDHIFVLPLRNHRFRVGATFGRNPINWLPTNEGLNELTTRLETLIHCDYQVVQHWAGIRPAMRDRKPIVGRHPNFPQLSIFNGLGSRGVLQAPYWASILAQQLVEPQTEIPHDVSVKRFYGR